LPPRDYASDLAADAVQSGTSLRRRVPVRSPQVKTMLKYLKRSRPIQVWLATISLIVFATAALGVSVTVSTGVMLLVLSVVLLAIVLWLLPRARSKTAADVLYGTDRRG
jgi:hypothetical protein